MKAKVSEITGDLKQTFARDETTVIKSGETSTEMEFQISFLLEVVAY